MVQPLRSLNTCIVTQYFIVKTNGCSLCCTWIVFPVITMLVYGRKMIDKWIIREKVFFTKNCRVSVGSVYACIEYYLWNYGRRCTIWQEAHGPKSSVTYIYIYVVEWSHKWLILFDKARCSLFFLFRIIRSVQIRHVHFNFKSILNAYPFGFTVLL